MRLPTRKMRTWQWNVKRKVGPFTIAINLVAVGRSKPIHVLELYTIPVFKAEKRKRRR